MMLGKKHFAKLLDSNMSFVYLFICDKFNYANDYETFLHVYKDWFKQHTTPNSKGAKK